MGNVASASKSWLRWFVGIAVVWLLAVGSLLVALYPHTPHSTAGWFVLLTLGPSLYLLGEAFFAWVFSPQHGRAVSKRSLSALRITLALAIVLPLFLAQFRLFQWLSKL